ncbi:SufE family protein [Patescibacteria group bacterium]|nr:SufE family protein [Patescibacteria group bacterium]
MTIQEIQEKIIKEFKNFNDWSEKYKYLIKLGKSLPPMDSKYIKKDYLVKDCQITTWSRSIFKDGKVFYDTDSTSIIVKGMVVLLKRIFSGQKPEDIINTDLYFIDKIGLRESCSPARLNDLEKLVNKIKLDAALYKTEVVEK